MKKGEYLSQLLNSQKTVFSFKDIALLWGDSEDAARKRISYYVKKGELKKVRRGFYVKDGYDPLELATKIYTPSYISFETVLAKEGVVFQYYNQIFVATYLTREILVDENNISYKKLKNSVLTSKKGIVKKENYMIASKERAFLDRLYLTPDYYFDNPSSLDWNQVFSILPIYENKRLKKRTKKIYKNVEEK